MKNLIQNVIHKGNADDAQVCDCNYDDNYYGDQVCVKAQK